jgi:hypothetical protein
MFLLSLNVIDNDIALANGIREGAVSFAPADEIREETAGFHPQRTAHFDVLDQVGQCYAGMQVTQNMDVILDAVDAEPLAVFVFDDAPDIPIQFIAVFISDGGLPVFGGKYDLVQDLAIAHGVVGIGLEEYRRENP